MRYARSLGQPMRSLLTALLLLAGIPAALGADTFSAGELSIPTVAIGGATYSNMVVTPGAILGVGGGTPSGGADSYNPVNQQLTIPAVVDGNTTYTNVLITVASLVSIGSVAGADSYDGAQLHIASVQVGSAVYSDVVITVSRIVSVANGMPAAVRDEYNLTNGNLSIPAVQVGARVYTNAIVTIAAIVSVGGAPITATPQQWTWVPFADAFCANGTTTGIGVNLSSASTRVLIYLEGGGACWSDLTCYTLQTAAHFTTGYGPAEFAAETTDTTYLAEPGGFFDRTDPSNPFRNDSYVYVPYCTGDVHAGNNVVAYDATHTAMQVGYANFTAYLQRIVPTFPSATLVTLAGSSAGGFGALINWDQTQRAFGSTPVDMIDDSGTLMPPDVFPQSNAIFMAWITNWNLEAALPAACTACLGRLDALWGYYASAYPADKGALLSYQQDTVLPTYYGITTAQFEAGLDEEETLIGANENQHYFAVDAPGHVLLFDPQLTAAGTTVQAWLTEMTTNQASWGSISAP